MLEEEGRAGTQASLPLSPKHQMLSTQRKALRPKCDALVTALGSGVSWTWVQILNLTITSSVALGRYFMLSVPF